MSDGPIFASLGSHLPSELLEQSLFSFILELSLVQLGQCLCVSSLEEFSCEIIESSDPQRPSEIRDLERQDKLFRECLVVCATMEALGMGISLFLASRVITGMVVPLGAKVDEGHPKF